MNQSLKLKEGITIKSPTLHGVKEINTNSRQFTKLHLYLHKIFHNIKSHKKKVIFILLGFGLFYYIYKKYLSPKIQMVMDFYSKFSEYKDILMNNGNNLDEILVKYEPCFSKLIKDLLVEVKNKLNNISNLENLYNNLRNSKKEELLTNWAFFKNKVIIYHFTSLIASRFLITISKIHYIILEKLQINSQKVDVDIGKKLLTELWFLAISFTDNLIEEIQNILEEPLNKISISSSFNWNSFMDEMHLLQEKLFDLYIDNFNNQINLKIFRRYVTDISKQIEILEKFNFNNEKNHDYKIEVFLKFYQIYFDIINSNLFHVILYKAINYDLGVIEKDLKSKFNSLIKEEIKKINLKNHFALNKNIDPEEIEKNPMNNQDNVSVYSDDIANHNLKLINIIIMMLKFKELILDVESSHFINKLESSDCKFQEEFNEFLKIIYD